MPGWRSPAARDYHSGRWPNHRTVVWKRACGAMAAKPVRRGAIVRMEVLPSSFAYRTAGLIVVHPRLVRGNRPARHNASGSATGGKGSERLPVARFGWTDTGPLGQKGPSWFQLSLELMHCSMMSNGSGSLMRSWVRGWNARRTDGHPNSERGFYPGELLISTYGRHGCPRRTPHAGCSSGTSSDPAGNTARTIADACSPPRATR
jgi:hypothetical protein